MIRPNLLLIGAMKCGTTSLHNYLDMHPEIQMSSPKELNFYSNEENFLKGNSYYSTFFQEGYRYKGESSVNYTKRHIFPEVSSRIKESLGDEVKLIYMVRDPIDRFQSNFTDSKTYGDIPSSYSINSFIEERLDDNPLLKTSMYYYQIENYLAHFDLNTMYFLKAEDLKQNPQATLDLLFEFLGLESIAVETVTQNQSVSKTYHNTSYVKLMGSPLVRALKKLMPSHLITEIKTSSLIKKLAKKEIDPAIDSISPKNRAVLKSYLAEDMKKFEELTNIKFY